MAKKNEMCQQIWLAWKKLKTTNKKSNNLDTNDLSPKHVTIVKIKMNITVMFVIGELPFTSDRTPSNSPILFVVKEAFT